MNISETIKKIWENEILENYEMYLEENQKTDIYCQEFKESTIWFIEYSIKEYFNQSLEEFCSSPVIVKINYNTFDSMIKILLEHYNYLKKDKLKKNMLCFDTEFKIITQKVFDTLFLKYYNMTFKEYIYN